ncbi:MAG: glycosyltransferase [Gammaproteobacteria bacterium]|nr:glycosyltransferase [Gammaproteobacteria bacterium]
MSKFLKILLVIETGGAGSGRHVVDLAEALGKQGHRVSVVYSPRRAENWFVNEISALENVRVYIQPMHRGPHFSDFSAISRIRKIIRDDGPFDIVHGHSSKGGAISRLASLGTGSKSLYTPHAFITMNHTMSAGKRFFYGSVERLLAPLADAIVCVSSAEHEHAAALKIPQRLLKTVPNGLRPLADENRPAIRAELGLKPTDVVIGFVGRLDLQKAVDRLIRAFAETAQQHPNARLVIVGQGAEEQRLRTLADTTGVAGRIVWTGPASGAKMMAAFDLFALPSIYEAFPYVLIEAAFRGLPIIATSVGGTAELVHDDYNGKIVTSHDATAFAIELNRIVGESDMRRRMGEASRELGKGFTVDVMASRTLALYKGLVSPS